MLGHSQTEDRIKESGMNYILFHNVLYMDTIPNFVGEKVFETGIHLAVGGGRVPFALRSEIGEAIANALLESSCDNSTYNLTGSESYSFDDVAAVLTKLSGQEVSYVPIEKSAFEAQLQERGLPDIVAQRIVGFMTDIGNGQEDEVSSDLRNLLGRKPAPLEEGLKILFKF